jgi:hypothetical protein
MKNNVLGEYSILVNTCDHFDDCWVPYFKLHRLYWPDCSAKIYLNTGKKDFSFPGIDVVALKVTGIDKTLTWSECLIRALDKIEDDIVLYMQEDYFLKAPVKNELVEKYVQLMTIDQSIDCIHLTDQAVISDDKSSYDGLYKVKLKQRYRVSCQAALWRKGVLKSYLRTHESAWQFEEFASKRAGIMNHNFYVVDPAFVKLNVFEIIPYLFTGIVQGRWKEEVVPLFFKHGIDIQYSKRGFLNDAPKKKLLYKVKTFIKRFPAILRSYIDLFFMKLKINE